MAEKENPDSLLTQRVKQQISVPFCWEEKPGRPKRSWGLTSAPAHPVSSSTATSSAASVPFKWEEKPGTPLPEESAQSVLDPPLCAPLVRIASPSPQEGCKDQCRWSNNPFIGEEEGGKSIELDVEAFPFDAGTAPFPPRQSFISEPFIGCFDRPRHGCATENPDSNEYPSAYSDKCETWDSDSTAETDGDSDSSGSGMRRSAEDVSTLEFLFPLLSPELSFLNEVCHGERADPASHPDPAMRKICMNRCNLGVKRGPTLGELILLSRRLSRGRHDPTPKGKQGFRLVCSLLSICG